MEVYMNIILPNCHRVAMIPVIHYLKTDEIWQDTALIIDKLEEIYPSSSSSSSSAASGKMRQVNPTSKSPKQLLVSQLFELLGDECLVPAAMHYRWSFPENRKYIEHEFGRLNSPNSPPLEQAEIARNGPIGKFSGFLPGLGVNQTSIPFIESEYLQLLSLLEIHFQSHKFLLGNRPCIGDFALIGPLYAHLYRDPYPGKIMKSGFPLVANYVERVTMLHSEVSDSTDFSAYSQSENDYSEDGYLRNDGIPATLIAIINDVIFKHYMPLFRQEQILLQNYLTKNEGNVVTGPIPRGLGPVKWHLDNGVVVERVAQSFHVFKLQRVIDRFAVLSENDKQSISSIIPLASTYLNIDISKYRVKLFNNKLTTITAANAAVATTSKL